MPRVRSPSPRRGRSPARAAHNPPPPKPPAPDTLRSIIFRLGFALVGDIFEEAVTLCMLIFLLALPWRAHHAVKCLFKSTRERRNGISNQFGELLADIFVSIPASLIVLVTIYRIPRAIVAFRGPFFRDNIKYEAREAVSTIAAYLCAGVLYATMWRIRYLHDQQAATGGNYSWSWKKIYYFQFLQLLCDIVVLPLLPFLVLGFWRVKDLYVEHFAPAPSTKVAYNRSYSQVYGAMRLAVVKTVGEILLDYFSFLFVLLIVVTVIRIPTLWRAIRHRKDEKESFRESLRRTFEEELATTKLASSGAPITVGHAAVAAAPAGTDAQIRAAKENLQGLAQVALKEMLRRNDQAFSGLSTKQLIEKIADQQVRGRIPRCPRCFAGKLRFENNRYYCPGYADDDGRFHRCSFTARDGEVARLPWQN